ncbi:uncharacterized protein KY384_006670 [Bacidia gigantensis]|uniref:uncharacterized protein n=1 Tax=Bacidia gigantensis TaxID=2732470 RepID=UPI001D0456AE|nr:uncharacterized protein KY384_006670 [Bacidia gigantensis]KAG8528981.1 hypothetical protein KY384_006670 [Bacidia gigantensis]
MATSTKSWLEIPSDSPFSLANIPFGIISTSASPRPRTAIAIGDYALDLSAFAKGNGFSEVASIQTYLLVFDQPTLNDFAALPQSIRRDVRSYIQQVFQSDSPHAEILTHNSDLKQQVLLPLSEVRTHLPFAIGDYTDFYVGLHHAQRCSDLFGLTLHPNYRSLPTAYHGRASSVVVSGTNIRRPWGQYLPDPMAKEKIATYAPTQRLDYELELGAFICGANKLGEPIPIDQAKDNIFGLVLLNDWSVRDVQMWEMPPLGPFNAKNLGTSVSPWVITLEALEPFATTGIPNDREILPYMKEANKQSHYDIRLEVAIAPKATGKSKTISHSNASNLLWSYPQMLAHHSVTGCNMRVGDLLGSGTVSGKEDGSEGCLLEQTKAAKVPVKLDGGEERRFLEDGDTVTFRGFAGKEGALVGFGECTGMIEPALKH